jgi:hypothetical protein
MCQYFEWQNIQSLLVCRRRAACEEEWRKSVNTQVKDFPIWDPLILTCNFIGLSCAPDQNQSRRICEPSSTTCEQSAGNFPVFLQQINTSSDKRAYLPYMPILKLASTAYWEWTIVHGQQQNHYHEHLQLQRKTILPYIHIAKLILICLNLDGLVLVAYPVYLSERSYSIVHTYIVMPMSIRLSVCPSYPTAASK